MNFMEKKMFIALVLNELQKVFFIEDINDEELKEKRIVSV